MITNMRGCAAHNNLWPWPVFSGSFRHEFAIKLLKYLSRVPCPLCNMYISGWILSILGTNDYSMWRCVTHSDIQPWPISSRSFRLDFAVKPLKYGTNCCVCSTACTVLDLFFCCLAQMITSIRGSVECNDLWPWLISSRSFSHDFAIKLLKYNTSCHVCSTACTVLDGFFPCLAQMSTSMRGCVTCNDLWPSPISKRSFSYDFAIKLLKSGTSCCVCLAAPKVLDEFLYARLKNGRIMLWQCPSVCPSVRPSVRPSFPDFFSTCFEISIWNLVYGFSRWHDMSSLSFITIGSLWPSLQPKVGQTQFLQSWPYKSR